MKYHDIKYQYIVTVWYTLQWGTSMKTAPVRIAVELKEQLENAMKQYRHKTGENITISETVNRLLMEPDFKLFVGWEHE